MSGVSTGNGWQPRSLPFARNNLIHHRSSVPFAAGLAKIVTSLPLLLMVITSLSAIFHMTSQPQIPFVMLHSGTYAFIAGTLDTELASARRPARANPLALSFRTGNKTS